MSISQEDFEDFLRALNTRRSPPGDYVLYTGTRGRQMFEQAMQEEIQHRAGETLHRAHALLRDNLTKHWT